MLILKQLRGEKKINQSDLALAIGVSLRTIQLYERKNANIPIKNLTKIAHYFNTDLSELYSQEAKEKRGPYNRSITKSSKGHSIVKLAPGKYLLSAPLVTDQEQNEYIKEHDNLTFISTLVLVGFMVDQVSTARYSAFEISNNAMSNGHLEGIPKKSIVLGKQVSKRELPRKIKDTDKPLYWIIVNEDSIICREIIDYDKKKGVIICHSLNDAPEYPDFEIDMEKVKQFFMIIKKQVD